MSIRVTGMNSGMDTDAMVKELVSAYQKKGDKTVKEKTKLEWKQLIQYPSWLRLILFQ